MSVFERDGTKLYFEQTGTGDPVLFIQGVGVIGNGWRPQVDGLKDQFSTLIFDNRGIGQSLPCGGPITVEAMAQDAAALLDHVGWSSAHVVGHSLGGVVAQQLALSHPEKVKSLALLCTFARGVDGARPTPRVIWLGLRSRVGTARMRRKAFVQMLMPREFLSGLDCQVLAKQLEPIIGRDLAYSPQILMRQLKALGANDLSGRLSELGSIPTLVVSGRHDPIALPKFGRELAAGIPGAAYIEIEDGSHGVTIQQPGRINQLLKQFFSAAAGAARPGDLSGRSQ